MGTPDRDSLQARMTEADIGTLIHYPTPPHMQAAYAGLGIAPGAPALGPRTSGRRAQLANGASVREQRSERSGNQS